MSMFVELSLYGNIQDNSCNSRRRKRQFRRLPIIPNEDQMMDMQQKLMTICLLSLVYKIVSWFCGMIVML